MLTIGFLVYENMQALDVVGPLDVFGSVNEIAGGDAYQLVQVGLSRAHVRAENGLVVVPDTSLHEAPLLDTLIIPGGAGSRVVNRDGSLLNWITIQASTARRIVSVCTGIYLLAATGLLDGRRATTHWRFAADVRKQFPHVQLNADPLYVRDDKFWSSGGLTAGMDLALALVEQDTNARLALSVARNLVMYMKRPGNQAQFSAPLDAQSRGSGRLAAFSEWLLAHLREDLTVERMADAAHMSARNFRRVFVETFDATPARYVERLRLEQACVLLTGSNDSIEHVASVAGFSSADTFRRAFRARYGASPLEYRSRFSR